MSVDHATPAVSVLLPTFNRLPLLPRALAALQEQTFDDFEVVLVNDGGEDPAPVVDRFPNLRINLITRPANGGVTAALNTALRAASGRYIILLGDDDRWFPDHLATLVGEAEARGGACVVYTDGERVIEDDAGRELARDVVPVPADFDRARLLVTNFIPGHTLLIPAAAYERAGAFDERLEVLEDWDMWIRISEHWPFVHLPRVTCEYRLRGGRENITTRETFRFQRCLERVYAKHEVPAGSPLAAARADMLRGTALRADMFIYELSVLVVSDGRARDLMVCLGSVVDTLGEGSYEVIVHAPRTDEIVEVARDLDGDFTLVLSESEVSTADAEATLRRKAAGRHVLVVHSSELVDRVTVNRVERNQPAAVAGVAG